MKKKGFAFYEWKGRKRNSKGKRDPEKKSFFLGRKTYFSSAAMQGVKKRT